MKELKKDREVFLAFEKGIGEALSIACSIGYDSERYILAGAKKIIHRDIFNQQKPFTGSFEAGCRTSLCASIIKSFSVDDITTTKGEPLK